MSKPKLNPANTNLLTVEQPAIQARMPESKQNKNKTKKEQSYD